MKKKLLDFISVFESEVFVIVLFVVVLAAIAVSVILGKIITPIMGMDTIFVMSCGVGMIALVLLIVAVRVLMNIILVCIGYFQKVFIGKIRLFRHREEIQEKLQNTEYHNIEECLYDIVPHLVRRRTFSEWRNDTVLRTKYRIIVCAYTANLMEDISSRFSTAYKYCQLEIDSEGKKINCDIHEYNTSGDLISMHQSLTINEIMRKNLQEEETKA